MAAEQEARSAAQGRCKHGCSVRADDPTVQECIDGEHPAASPSPRVTCWICGKKLRKPDKAPRALCGICATSGGLGPYT